jgi:hypothetical protein
MNALQDLLDRQALADLAAAYCRAVDRREFALLEALYHPDAVHDHGAMFRGAPDAFIAWLQQSPRDLITQHFIGNALYTTHGDKAEGEIYALNYHVIGGERDYVAGGRYLDHYIRENGRWWIWSRKRLVDWTYEGPSAPAPTAQGLTRGVNGPDDDSYKTLPNLAAFWSGRR